MDEIRSYRGLKVWQRGMSLAEDVYRLAAGYPRETHLNPTITDLDSYALTLSSPPSGAKRSAERGPSIALPVEYWVPGLRAQAPLPGMTV